MPEFSQKRDVEEPGLSTADLANLDEPNAANQKMNREQAIDQVNSERRRSLDADVQTVERRSAGMMARNDTAERENAGMMDTSQIGSRDQSQDQAAPLFSSDESKEFHSRWDAIQVSFVDEPRQAVQQADGLVASAMKRLAEIFAEERGHLDQQWDRGSDVSTEELRVALRRYRSFFGRLLSV